MDFSWHLISQASPTILLWEISAIYLYKLQFILSVKYIIGPNYCIQRKVSITSKGYLSLPNNVWRLIVFAPFLIIIIIITNVDIEKCCPKGKCGCQYFILLTLKKKKFMDTVLDFFNKKTNPGLLFLPKVRSCVFISNFHHSPPLPPKGYKIYKLLTWVTLLNHAESVCFKSVIQSGRSLFLSKIKIHR
jgi:hypothetical protein